MNPYGHSIFTPIHIPSYLIPLELRDDPELIDWAYKRIAEIVRYRVREIERSRREDDDLYRHSWVYKTDVKLHAGVMYVHLHDDTDMVKRLFYDTYGNWETAPNDYKQWLVNHGNGILRDIYNIQGHVNQMIGKVLKEFLEHRES